MPNRPNMLTMPVGQSIDSGPPAEALAVGVRGVSHAYGARRALDSLSLDIGVSEIFAILGPNGGGKTTLFRLLSTLMPLQTGAVSILGHDLARETVNIRRSIGVVFQAPSLDRKLTVAENIRLQACLYGLWGGELARRLEELLERFALRDRAHDLVEQLSGGLRRRVELAKGMIHEPRLLLLDEPTTGLDPAARSDVWQYLRNLREAHGTTILFTTHFLDEADAADRLAIMNEGRLVAIGAPGELRSQIGGDSITLETDQPDSLAFAIHQQLGLATQVLDGSVRLEAPDGHMLISRIFAAFPGRITAVRLGKPTLDDVFIARTGHRFWDQRRKEGPL